MKYFFISLTLSMFSLSVFASSFVSLNCELSQGERVKEFDVEINLEDNQIFGSTTVMPYSGHDDFDANEGLVFSLTRDVSNNKVDSQVLVVRTLNHLLRHGQAYFYNSRSHNQLGFITAMSGIQGSGYADDFQFEQTFRYRRLAKSYTLNCQIVDRFNSK